MGASGRRSSSVSSVTIRDLPSDELELPQKSDFELEAVVVEPNKPFLRPSPSSRVLVIDFVFDSVFGGPPASKSRCL